jgi:hypothetical protein
MVGQLRDRLNLFRPLKEARRPWQMLRPIGTAHGMQRRHTSHRAFGKGAFDGRQPKDLVRIETNTEGIDQLADIHIGTIPADMPPDGLPLGERFDPGCRECRGLDAETGVDYHKAFGEKFRKMPRLAVGSRETDTRGLRDVIDAREDEIETPCADASCLQFHAKIGTEFFDNALQVFGIADRLGETQLRARHFRRYERWQRLDGAAERLIEAQEHFAAEAQLQTRSRLARQMCNALNAHIMQ